MTMTEKPWDWRPPILKRGDRIGYKSLDGRLYIGTITDDDCNNGNIELDDIQEIQ